MLTNKDERRKQLIDIAQEHVHWVLDQEAAVTLAVIRTMDLERKFTLTEVVGEIEKLMEKRDHGDPVRRGLGLARSAVSEMILNE